MDAPETDRPEVVPGEYNVCLTPEAAEREDVGNYCRRLAEQFGGRLAYHFHTMPEWFSVHELAEEQAQALAEHPDVELVEPNVIIYFQPPP